jgi:hypothetical protein
MPMRPGRWMTRVRADPKGAMEADLILAAAGVFIIVMGGLVAVAGIHRAWTTGNAGNPALGNMMAAVGLLVVVMGLILGIVNLVIWLTGRRRGIEAEVKPDENEDLLQSMRADGHPDRPT